MNTMTPTLPPLPDITTQGYTFDCARETVVELQANGLLYHWPALSYEIENYCGHAPTIDHLTGWTGEPLLITNVDGTPLEQPSPAPNAPQEAETTPQATTGTASGYDGPQLAATGPADAVGSTLVLALIAIGLGIAALAVTKAIAAHYHSARAARWSPDSAARKGRRRG